MEAEKLWGGTLRSVTVAPLALGSLVETVVKLVPETVPWLEIWVVPPGTVLLTVTWKTTVTEAPAGRVPIVAVTLLRKWSHAIRGWLDTEGLVFGRKAALTLGEVAVHETVAVLQQVGVRQAQGVAHFVKDGGEKVESSCRSVRGAGVTAGGILISAKQQVTLRAGIDEPAVAARITTDTDDVRAGFTKAQ